MLLSAPVITCMQSGLKYRPSWSCKSVASDLRFETDSKEPTSHNRMFILGMGFVGQFFAAQLKKQGWSVSGTCTSINKKKQLEDIGFDVYLFDANDPDPSIIDAMKYHTHLVVSIPTFVGIGDPLLQHEHLLQSTLLDGNLQWLCYMSSTSVYGNCGGSWIDEDHPANPTSELAKLRLAAEDKWLYLGNILGLSSRVLRLGGIYGPARSAIDTIIKQENLTEKQRRREYRQYISRVHVHDICQALEASISTFTPRKVYNIVDNDPAPREEVFAYAWNLIERKWPGQIKKPPDLEREEPGINLTYKKRGLSGEKRVMNARMKTELGVELLYPSYRSGLQSIIDQMNNPFQQFGPSSCL